MIPTPPKTLQENIAYRGKILEWVDEYGKPFQEELWIACKRDIVFWLDTFGWTYAPVLFPDAPHRPFITWPYQETALRKIDDSIDKGTDLIIEKSRDMGASWMVVATFCHRFQFRDGQSFLFASRKEEYVDKTGDPKTLFWKLDYLLDRQPLWLQPPGWQGTRIRLHVENPTLGSAVDGESANPNMARGDRRQAINLDEFAYVEDGYAVLNACQAATRCRIFVSTPQGASGAYYDQLVKMKNETPDRVIRLHWTLHPEKAHGKYIAHADRVELFDDYPFPEDYPFVRDGKTRSPWYDEECRRSATEWLVKQEIDIEYVSSGTQAIDQMVVDRIVQECRAPDLTGEMTFIEGGREPKWFETHGGRVKLWVSLTEDGRPPPGRYVAGSDISQGKGGDLSSQSVTTVYNHDTRQKVAEFCVSDLDPTDFCRYTVALCRWFHNAYLVPERNGPGEQFCKKLVEECQYFHFFFNRDEARIDNPRGKTPGWWSTATTKMTLLLDYFGALKEGQIKNLSSPAVKETVQYQIFSGKIVHCKSRFTLDETGKGELHGDMVIADALAWRGMKELGLEKPAETPESAPIGSFGYRLQQNKKAATKKQKFY